MHVGPSRACISTSLTSHHYSKEEKPYLFQIVANKTNGLDVDKRVVLPIMTYYNAWADPSFM